MTEINADSEPPMELQGVYFNGFQLALTNGDVSGIMLLNGQPQVVLNMSYTVAKSLSVGLTELITKLEELTGRDIMTTKEVESGMAGLMAKEAKND